MTGQLRLSLIESPAFNVFKTLCRRGSQCFVLYLASFSGNLSLHFYQPVQQLNSPSNLYITLLSLRANFDVTNSHYVPNI